MDTPLTVVPPTPHWPALRSADVWLTPPTFEQVHGVWLRYHQTPVEVIDPDLSLCGQYVAFFEGRPWGYDRDPTALRDRVEAALNVHPNWVVLSYLGSIPVSREPPMPLHFLPELRRWGAETVGTP